MARHIDFGKKGEDLAEAWLISSAYEILHRNWRKGRYEVDIIARHQGIYHFIEVKSGRSDDYGHPEERVSKQKIRNMMKGAAAWLQQFPGPKRIQYDVLAITIREGEAPEYFLIGDVYE
ncbi:MAG TPA: YraN family protein [Puia sp.]|nr:YraN family protein [Puia sp.]